MRSSSTNAVLHAEFRRHGNFFSELCNPTRSLTSSMPIGNNFLLRSSLYPIYLYVEISRCTFTYNRDE